MATDHPETLLRRLEQSTQASRRFYTIDEDVGAAAWRVAQPPHVVFVEPQQQHLLAYHVGGPCHASAGFGGDRRIERRSEPGRSTILPAGCDWASDIRGGRIDFFHLMVPGDMLAAAADGADLRLSPRLAVDDPNIDHAALRLLTALSTADVDPIRAKACLWDVVLALAQPLRQGTRGPSKGGLTPRKAAGVIDFMEENLSSQLRLERLAAEAGLSPFHFSRVFAATFGSPPHRYLRDMRARRAKRLLADRRLSLAEIATAVGFRDQARFTTAFGASTGVAPGAYRKLIA